MTRGSVLLVQFSAQRDGSAFSGLLTAQGLREGGWAVTAAFASEGPMRAAYERDGFPTLLAPHKNWLRQKHPLRAARAVAREVASGRTIARTVPAPDLVYLNTGASVAGALAARRWGVPCVWHVRELLSDVGGELVVPAGARPFVRATFERLSSQLVVNSAAVAENVLGPKAAGQVEVVFNAVGPRFFDEARTKEEARADLGLPKSGRLIGVPGTLRPMKGHPFCFEAVAPLLAQHADLRVAVTGAGAPDYEARLRADVAARGIADRVAFTGSIVDMPGFYRACDLACIPSRSEPFGRTVVESFAVGTPVVATAVGGIRETVRDGENGLLVPYGDAAALTSALGRLLSDAGLGAALARSARADAERRFAESAYKARVAAIVAAAARA